jgi:hypothetical protein
MSIQTITSTRFVTGTQSTTGTRNSGNTHKTRVSGYQEHYFILRPGL